MSWNDLKSSQGKIIRFKWSWAVSRSARQTQQGSVRPYMGHLRPCKDPHVRHVPSETQHGLFQNSERTLSLPNAHRKAVMWSVWSCLALSQIIMKWPRQSPCFADLVWAHRCSLLVLEWTLRTWERSHHEILHTWNFPFFPRCLWSLSVSSLLLLFFREVTLGS